jgi:hypothetical protein
MPDAQEFAPKVRFAPDSPVEGDGFESSVPVKKNPPVETII